MLRSVLIFTLLAVGLLLIWLTLQTRTLSLFQPDSVFEGEVSSLTTPQLEPTASLMVESEPSDTEPVQQNAPTSVPEPTVAPTPTVAPPSAAEIDEQPQAILFDFQSEDNAWYSVNDDVMGGISTSAIALDREAQYMSFTGNLSLENNGGFASIRSEWTEYDLENYSGIMLRVRGDGQIYRFRIRTEETGANVSYTALFATEADRWQEIYIPFAKMTPLYRGFIVNDVGALDPASVRSFGFMFSDKQVGAFSLDIDQIVAINKDANLLENGSTFVSSD